MRGGQFHLDPQELMVAIAEGNWSGRGALAIVELQPPSADGEETRAQGYETGEDEDGGDERMATGEAGR